MPVALRLGAGVRHETKAAPKKNRNTNSKRSNPGRHEKPEGTTGTYRTQSPICLKIQWFWHMTRMRPKPFHSIEKLKNATFCECPKTLEIIVKPSDAQLQQVKITKTEKKEKQQSPRRRKDEQNANHYKTPDIYRVWTREAHRWSVFFS